MTTEQSIPRNALRETTVLPFTALTTSLRATLSTVVDLAMPLDQQLRDEAARLGLDASVPTQWIYTGINADADNEFVVEIALPISPETGTTPNRPFEIKAFPAFHCLQYDFKGSWEDFSAVYTALFDQLYASGRRYNGQVREVYRVVNMDAPEQCQTDIQIGLSQ